jgi:hypothetical protein
MTFAECLKNLADPVDVEASRAQFDNLGKENSMPFFPSNISR